MVLSLAASSGESVWPILAICAGAVIAISSLVWSHRRGQTVVNRWAAAHGYRVIAAELRWFAQGPFFWKSSKSQAVYRVTMADAEGNARHGWARCGGWVLGLLTDEVTVRWDEPPPEARGFPVVMPGKAGDA